MRKRVLELRHLFFGGSDEENYELGLDRVFDIEMFYLVSLYFSFPNGFGILGRVFRTRKLLGLSNALNSSADYCYRTFIARLTSDPWLGWLRFPSLSSILFSHERTPPCN
ncbi:hypothetical protein AMTRI_Chr10g229770 [Amborella trichopoda]